MPESLEQHLRDALGLLDRLLQAADTAVYEAKEAGRDIRVGRFMFSANGKAIALGEDQGMVKTLFDRATGELLGAPCGVMIGLNL